MFLDDITDHLTDLLTANQNNLIMGDFNIHINDPTDSDASIFNDTMVALGLVQHFSISTHNKGNTSDLICTKLGTNLSASKIQSRPMVSDHRLIYTSLNIQKPVVKKDRVTVRKISVIMMDQLCQEFSDHTMLDVEDLDMLIHKFDAELTKVMDALALKKKLPSPHTKGNPGMTKPLADPGGHCQCAPPPTGSISFIFAYVFTEKCTH